MGSRGCGGCIGPAVVWHSNDGKHWHRVGDDVDGSPAYASGGGRIVRFDQQSGNVFTSTDGSTWRKVGHVGHLLEMHGMVIGAHGLLLREQILRHGTNDETDGAVQYVDAR